MGRVVRIGRHHWNLAVEPFKTVVHDGALAVPDWGVKVGITLLLPEHSRSRSGGS